MPSSINACIAQGLGKGLRGCRGPVAGARGLGLGPPRSSTSAALRTRGGARDGKIGAGSAFGFLAQPREAHRDGAARRDAAGDGLRATRRRRSRRSTSTEEKGVFES